MIDATTFDQLKIGLATSADIRAWSYGEVKKPETINYRTLKPEKDGLFGEQIFGPSRDWECSCGKYKRVRFKGIVCERCGVEVTKSSVRRERMGHIELAAPVTHIWYFKGVPSRLGYLLDMAPKDLEKVIYFAAYMVISVDEDARHADLPGLENELRLEIKQLEQQRDSRISERLVSLETDLAALEEEGAKADQKRKVKDGAEKEMSLTRRGFDEQIAQLERVWEDFRTLKVGDLKPEDSVFHELQDRYGLYFEAYMGAESIQKRLEAFDLPAESEFLHDQIANGKGQKKIRAIKRLRVVNSFIQTGNSPAAMVLDVVPVIPPELRPMVQLDGGRFATSDLNDLYRRVINRNNRLRRLLDLGAPEIIVNNEKRMLQEAVDALFDNGRRGRPVTGTGNRALKSLSDMLKGKQGRFRQNLLGKRVDYSGRSVIIVGPQLKLHQCGLPKQMALELFKPFVIKRLIDLSHAQNIKSAKRMVERSRPQVWDVLEEIIRERPVLLNRAPTLHRLGIQAFEPQLVEGKAIQLHPLVCAAFNADFDGDQMAVHLPLSVEAQAEARILMLASNNILKPSDGRPVTLPSQDMIIGLHHLTSVKEGAVGEGRAFSSVAEAILAKDQHSLDLNAVVRIRVEGVYYSEDEAPEGFVQDSTVLLTTTLGRALFNETLPVDYPYVEAVADKGKISAIVNDLAERYPKVEVAAALDRIKDAGFHWATRSGVTVALSDILTPKEKPVIVARHEKRAAKVQGEFDKGLIDDASRRRELIDIWTEATNEVAAAMQENFPKDNNIYRMVSSGARGNWLQVRNIAGIRGLVSNPKGETIPRPIISSYREGLSVAEYFIATHGARKGLADTALRTADSGYLTRRLVDVAQDVIIREDDCGTTKGLELRIAAMGENGELVRDENVENSVYARSLAEDAVDAKGKVVAEPGSDVGDVLIAKLIAAGVETRQGSLGAHLRVHRRRVRGLLRPFARDGQARRHRRGGRNHRRPVDRRARHPAHDAYLPLRWFGLRGRHHAGSAPRDGAVRGPHPEGREPDRRGARTRDHRGHGASAPRHPDAGQRRRAADLPGAQARDPPHRGRAARRARPAVRGRKPRPEGGAARAGRPRRAAAPRRRCAGGLPLAGRADPRQAHRGHRPSDAAQGDRRRARRHRAASGRARRPCPLQRDQPRHAHRGQEDGLGASGGHGYHQGFARDRVVAVGGLLPGDHPRAHAGRHGGSFRPAHGPQGERHHRSADPRGHRSQPVPQRDGRGHRGGEGGALPEPHLHRRLGVQRGRPELRRLRQLQLGRLHARHLQLSSAERSHTRAPDSVGGSRASSSVGCAA